MNTSKTNVSAPQRHHERAPLLVLAVGILATMTLSAAPSSRKVTIGTDGKLDGAASGYAWVAGSDYATIVSPQPCNTSGCFKNTGGQLCTKGSIAALACTGQGTAQLKCNWDKNWGLVLGMNTRHPVAPWGSDAPRSLSVSYGSIAHGGSAGHFRLTAHVAGDPPSKQYCVDNYSSGAAVQARDLRSQCWFNSGEVLQSFDHVDTLGLMRVSENAPVSFDFCVTAINAD